jgi:HlyD family secretion protein
MKRRLRIILPLLLIGSAGIFAYRYFIDANDELALRFSGNIEVTEAQMSFRIPGRLRARVVDEGDFVTVEQPLARLENTDQTIAVAQAEANLGYARAVLAELEAGSRQEDIDRAEAKVLQARHSLTELQNGSRIEEIEAAQAELDRASAAEQSAASLLNRAKNELARYNRLHKDGLISEDIFENFQTRYDNAQDHLKEAQGRTRSTAQQLSLLKAGPRIEEIQRAEASLKQAEAEYALVSAGPRVERIDQARAKVRLAAEEVKQARQQLAYTELISPMDAVVLSVSAEPGEFLNPASPVLTLGSTSRPWLRAYINENELGKIKLNQEVEVSTDSFPGKTYKGRVSFISSQAEFTPKTVQTFEERVKLMYRIKVALDNPENELKPGMPADGFISLADR